jgi:hypothetical protein
MIEVRLQVVRVSRQASSGVIALWIAAPIVLALTTCAMRARPTPSPFPATVRTPLISATPRSPRRRPHAGPSVTGARLRADPAGEADRAGAPGLGRQLYFGVLTPGQQTIPLEVRDSKDSSRQRAFRSPSAARCACR